MKKEEPNTKENIEKLTEVIESKKKIPKKVKDNIVAKAFENLLFFAIITVYLGSLNLGIANIPTENYLTDLKVFSIILLALTIILFEMGYKKDKSVYWLHGIEILIVAIFTTYLIYLYYLFYNSNILESIIFSVIAIYFIYYITKILIIRKKIIKEYNKSLIDIGEIVKK